MSSVVIKKTVFAFIIFLVPLIGGHICCKLWRCARQSLSAMTLTFNMHHLYRDEMGGMEAYNVM